MIRTEQILLLKNYIKYINFLLTCKGLQFLVVKFLFDLLLRKSFSCLDVANILHWDSNLYIVVLLGFFLISFA